MADYLDGHGVTHLFLTTQVGRQFVLYARPRYLRYLSVGGEKLVTLDPPEGYEFLNVYGPTETTIYLTEPYGNRGWGTESYGNRGCGVPQVPVPLEGRATSSNLVRSFATSSAFVRRMESSVLTGVP